MGATKGKYMVTWFYVTNNSDLKNEKRSGISFANIIRIWPSGFGGDSYNPHEERVRQKVKATCSSTTWSRKINYKKDWIGTVQSYDSDKKEYRVRWELNEDGDPFNPTYLGDRQVTRMSIKHMDLNFPEERRRLSQQFPPFNAVQDRLVDAEDFQT